MQGGGFCVYLGLFGVPGGVFVCILQEVVDTM